MVIAVHYLFLVTDRIIIIFNPYLLIFYATTQDYTITFILSNFIAV
jgi:hypothetical protein